MFDIIVVFKKSTTEEQIEELIKDFELVPKKRDGYKLHASMPERDFMGTADLEDLSEADEVSKLLWEDGSVCHPRG